MCVFNIEIIHVTSKYLCEVVNFWLRGLRVSIIVKCASALLVSLPALVNSTVFSRIYTDHLRGSLAC